MIDAPLLTKKHHDTNIRTIVVVDHKGKPSKTHIRPLEYFKEFDMTLIEAKPITGRQHQIRVHLFHVEHSIVGDPVYGQSDTNKIKYFDRELTLEDRLSNTKSDRLLLHANNLQFTLYNKSYNIYSKIDFKKEALKSIQQAICFM